jgi:hypothetical protein
MIRIRKMTANELHYLCSLKIIQLVIAISKLKIK